MAKNFMFLGLLAGLAGLSGCTSLPEGVEPVKGFELERYLGTWYEIARLDHPFERGLSNVTAEYTLNKDGSIRVVNRGWDAENDQRKTAVGKAKLAGDEDTGKLKVTFFWPFYSGYYIIALDRDGYNWAVVSSGENYFWILARQPEMESELYRKLVDQAREWGFAVDELIYPVQG